MTTAPAVPDAPADVGAAIRATKAALKARIGDYAGVFAQVEEAMRREVDEIVALRARGAEIWPEIPYTDVAAGTVAPDLITAVRRRGCAVIRGTFPRERAAAWDAELVSYLEDNRFFEQYTHLDDGIFGGLAAARPSIFPIYWSRPQLEAREDERMVAVRGFLNSLWHYESEGRVWFDPTRDTAYPDRVRRRAPGTTSTGLSPHVDSGSIERWLVPAYQQVFRHVFDGRWEAYDPWDGAYRTEVHEYPSTVMCSAFRTFQGWTALSEMRHTEGVLNVLPIPSAMVYVLLRALQDDVPDHDLCGAANGQALPISPRHHAMLLPAMCPIPDVAPGDTVWWHGDGIHAVDPVAHQQGWANVMYIPAAPHCAKNAAYAQACGRAFRSGESPPDFAPEHYEVDWPGRPGPGDLSATGRQQLGLERW